VSRGLAGLSAADKQMKWKRERNACDLLKDTNRGGIKLFLLEIFFDIILDITNKRRR